MWRHAEVHRWVYGRVGEGAQRITGYTEVCGVYRGAYRNVWGYTGGAQRWAKVHSGVLKCMEGCMGLQRGAHRCVEVHRGYRGACRGTQRGV